MAAMTISGGTAKLSPGEQGADYSVHLPVAADGVGAIILSAYGGKIFTSASGSTFGNNSPTVVYTPTATLTDFAFSFIAGAVAGPGQVSAQVTLAMSVLGNDPFPPQSISIAAAWYYGNQVAAEDAISAAGLAIATNMENTDLLANSARLMRNGQFCDAWMDARFRAMGFTTPLPLTDATDQKILEQISVAMVIAQLCRWRILQLPDGFGGAYTTITKLASNFENYAENVLSEIGGGRIKLAAARNYNVPGDNAGAIGVNGLPLYPQAPPGFGIGGGILSTSPLP